jgi:hypothetical protein
MPIPPPAAAITGRSRADRLVIFVLNRSFTVRNDIPTDQLDNLTTRTDP